MKGINIFLDLKEFDKKILSKEERNRFVWKLNFLTDKARQLKKQGKLSQTMVNRIRRLWLFLPRDEKQKEIMTTEQFHSFFKIRPLDIKKTIIALEELQQRIKEKEK
jgi:hypothetical protein